MTSILDAIGNTPRATARSLHDRSVPQPVHHLVHRDNLGRYVLGLEPAGSAAITGSTQGTFAMQGWSGSIVPHWDPERVDAVEAIEDEEAIAVTRRLAEEEGIFARVSTGANVVGALRLAERLGPAAVIVTLAVDSGFKYLSLGPYVDT